MKPAVCLTMLLLLNGAARPSLDEILDFEGRTLQMAGAPSVPEGWKRVIDTRTVILRDAQGRKISEELKHGKFPHFVEIEHLKSREARSGRKCLRVYLQGAGAKLETAKPIPVDGAFVYSLGGFYRYRIPREHRVPGAPASRTRLALQAEFVSASGEQVKGEAAEVSVEVSAGEADWQAFPETLLERIPKDASGVKIALTVETGEFAGWVEVDDLHFEKRPKITVSAEGGDGKVKVRVEASGLPRGRFLGLAALEDYSGKVVGLERFPAEPVEGRFRGVVSVSGPGGGWYRAKVTISDRGRVLAQGSDVFAAVPRSPGSKDMGVVLAAGAPVPPYLGSIRPGFLVVKITPGADIGKRLRAAARMMEQVETTGSARYAWLCLPAVPGGTPPGTPFDDEALKTAIRTLKRQIHTWIIPPETGEKHFGDLLRAEGIRREILTANAPGGACISEAGSPLAIPEGSRFAVCRLQSKEISTPDVVWRTAELKAAGVERIAYELPPDGPVPPPALLASFYWTPRILSAEFAGGSGIAPGVKTLLFREKESGFLLYRTEKGLSEKVFTVAAGDSPAMNLRDLMGNSVPVRLARGLLDVRLKAEAFTSALDKVDLGLLETSMSVKVVRGREIESSYRFQPLTFSLANRLSDKRNMAAVVVPRLPDEARGWRLKPAFSAKPVLVLPNREASFDFRLRPSLAARPGRYFLALEIYPATLSGGHFTVFKEVRLHSPLRVRPSVERLDEKTLSLSLDALLDPSYPRSPGTIDVAIRTPFGSSETLISGLIPGGKAPAAMRFILPYSGSAYLAELHLTDRSGGLFYNSTITIVPPSR